MEAARFPAAEGCGPNCGYANEQLKGAALYGVSRRPGSLFRAHTFIPGTNYLDETKNYPKIRPHPSLRDMVPWGSGAVYSDYSMVPRLFGLAEWSPSSPLLHEASVHHPENRKRSLWLIHPAEKLLALNGLM